MECPAVQGFNAQTRCPYEPPVENPQTPTCKLTPLLRGFGGCACRFTEFTETQFSQSSELVLNSTALHPGTLPQGEGESFPPFESLRTAGFTKQSSFEQNADVESPLLGRGQERGRASSSLNSPTVKFKTRFHLSRAAGTAVGASARRAGTPARTGRTVGAIRRRQLHRRPRRSARQRGGAPTGSRRVDAMGM